MSNEVEGIITNVGVYERKMVKKGIEQYEVEGTLITGIIAQKEVEPMKIKEKIIKILLNVVLNWLLKKVRKKVGIQEAAQYQKEVKEFITRTEQSTGVKAKPKRLRYGEILGEEYDET